MADACSNDRVSWCYCFQLDIDLLKGLLIRPGSPLLICIIIYLEDGDVSNGF